MAEQDTGTASRRPNRRVVVIALGIIVALLAVGVLWWVFIRAGTTKVSAYFGSAVGIYEGSDVRVLGVKVGTVTRIEPLGKEARVDMRIDRGVDIPADAKAAQIIPSLVADRYIQLTPAYADKGPKMESGAVIPRDRTATPVEVDELYGSIDDLAKSLGPQGANKDGALSQLVGTLGNNLAGNGELLGKTLTELSGAARTVNDYRGDLFDTVRNLQVFVSALATNDQQVRDFNAQLSDISGFLAGERGNLGAALNQLSVALGDVARFVRDNRDSLASNADALVQVTQTLADNRQSLSDAVTLFPLGLSNLVNAYDAESGYLVARANLQNETQDPLGTVCRLLDFGRLVPGDPQFEALGRQEQPLLDQCKRTTDQATAGIKTPNLVLPFGILSGDNIQRNPVPGTVPGNQSPRFDTFNDPGAKQQQGGAR